MSEDISIIPEEPSNVVLTGGVSVTVQDAQREFINNNVGYYFDIIREHSVSIQNQITDNYLENNTSVQDHIAHAPLTVSLSGLSGEIFFTPPRQALDTIYTKYNTFMQSKFNNDTMANPYLMSDKLLAIPALIPQVDNVTQIAKNAIQYVESSVKRYTKIVKNFINKENKEARLWQIYRELKELSDSNTALIVETPYTVLGDMYIQTISLRQGNQNYISDLEITLKQINYADVSVTEADQQVLSKYCAYAQAEVENNGKAKSKSVSIAKSALNDWGITQEGSGIRR